LPLHFDLAVGADATNLGVAGVLGLTQPTVPAAWRAVIAADRRRLPEGLVPDGTEGPVPRKPLVAGPPAHSVPPGTTPKSSLFQPRKTSRTASAHPSHRSLSIPSARPSLPDYLTCQPCRRSIPLPIYPVRTDMSHTTGEGASANEPGVGERCSSGPLAPSPRTSPAWRGSAIAATGDISLSLDGRGCERKRAGEGERRSSGPLAPSPRPSPAWGEGVHRKPVEHGRLGNSVRLALVVD
jgi:hypothetical protein